MTLEGNNKQKDHRPSGEVTIKCNLVRTNCPYTLTRHLNYILLIQSEDVKKKLFKLTLCRHPNNQYFQDSNYYE